MKPSPKYKPGDLILLENDELLILDIDDCTISYGYDYWCYSLKRGICTYFLESSFDRIIIQFIRL